MTRDEMAAIAMRYDTVMSLAMLRAVGALALAQACARAAAAAALPDGDAYRDVAWCFANHGSPMDGMR